ncbi:MAG TPA: 2-hydroxyacyl-CoA dehydratase family protein [bacterium]|nr:2-hydroxyacyl-CoA dehydratase family protein [bacterium]
MFRHSDLERIKKALEEGGGRSAGWFCSYTPVELIAAAGLHPIRISGAVTPSGHADLLMHTNICPFIKSCLETLESGELDFIDMFIFTNGCDAQRRLYDVWRSLRPDKPAHLFCIPKLTGPDSLRRFEIEIGALKTWLEEAAGDKLTDDKIGKYIALYGKLRGLLSDLQHRGDISGKRMLEILLEAQRSKPETAIELIAAEEPAREQAHGAPRVLVTGGMIDDPEFIARIEKFGVRAIALDLCTGLRFTNVGIYDDHKSPVEALAEMYLLKTPCPRMICIPDTVDRLESLVSELKPDGVIVCSLKFCDTHLYNHQRIREMLRREGTKALFIESDYSSGSEQIDTRIQAFVEMLKG